MKKTRKFNFKTSIVLLLSLLLCFTMTMSIACGNNNGNSSSSSSAKEEEPIYPTDYQLITNGDFEFSTFEKEKDKFPVSSSIGWTQSRDSITTSAPSSSYSSGIVNTEDEAYKAIAEKAGFDKNDDGSYFNPGTPSGKGLIADGEFTGDAETENEDKLPTKGSKILMIHNETATAGEGTAQKFTSSSTLTLGMHEYAKVSVWVCTHDLKSNVQGVDFGAYIAIQNTLSSSTTPLIVKNINTNDAWVKYELYLEASEFATSSFKVVLGLGFGSGKLRSEFVEGFAYFDNVHYEVIDKAEYDEGIGAVAVEDQFKLHNDENEVNDELKCDEADVEFAANENGAFTTRTLSLTHARHSETLIDVDGNEVKNELSEGKADGEVYVDTLANAVAAVDSELKAPYDALMNNGAIYFNFTTPSSRSFETNHFTVGSNEFLRLSFWVNASVEYSNQKALTITLNDKGTGSSTPVETQIASSVVTKEDDNKNFNDWIEYVLYVSNVVDADDSALDRVFTLTFDFGITERSALTDGDWSLTKGHAIIAGFATDLLSEDDFAIANTSYAYAKKVALSADLPNGVEGEEEDDTYKFTHGATDNVAIETGVASNVTNYNGVVGNTKAVGGENNNAYANEKITAGVINTEYLDNYKESGLLTNDQATAIDGLEKLNENEYLQPLMIKAADGADVAYGYLGNSATLAANTTTLISIDVMVIGDASANIYVANSNALDRFNVLGVADDAKQTHSIVTVVNKDDCADGWFTVRFAITTGNEALSYRIELWNGARDGSANASGIVLFDNYTTAAGQSIEVLREELRIEYGDDDSTATVHNFTRVPTTYLSTDKDGKDVEQTKKYLPAPVYTSFANSKALIVDYSLVYTVDEVDNRTSTETDSSTSVDSANSSAEGSFSWALQITSIILVAVLIVLLVLVLVRAILKKRGSRRQTTASYYDLNSREAAGLKAEARNARLAKKAQEEAKAEAEEEVKPYDYDNMENNIVEENEETPVEEAEVPAEEVAPVDEATAPAEEAAPVEAPAEETPAEEEKKDN